MTLPSQKPGAAETLLWTEIGAGRDAGHAHARLVHLARRSWASRALRILDRRADRSRSPRRNALATHSAVMSSWVGPMPPVVNHIGG